MNNTYVPELDGIRAFCIVFTVLNHVEGRPWFIDGTVGVDTFFALSGWLITWLLLEERKRQASINLRAFYVRRIFRIAPLYYLTIAIYTVAAFAVLFHSGNTAKMEELRAAAAYLLSFNSEYRPEDAGVVFGHAWTLGIEEKFYFIWPLLLFWFGRSAIGSGVAAVAAVGILFSIFGVNEYLLRGYFGLGFGSGLALWVHSSPATMSFLSRYPLGLFLVFIAMALYAGLIVSPGVIWHLGLAVCSGLLIANVWFCREQSLAQFLRSAPLTWLGVLTYAIYLLHTLAINVAEGAAQKLHLPSNFATIFIAGYAISIGAAWLVRILVERPAIEIGRRIARRSTYRVVPTA